MSELPTDADNVGTDDTYPVYFPMDLTENNNATEPHQTPDGNLLRPSVVVLSPVAIRTLYVDDPSTAYAPPNPGRSTASLSPLDPNSTADHLEAVRSDAAVAPASAFRPLYNNFVYANYNPYYEAVVRQRIQTEQIQQQQFYQHQHQMQLQQQTDFNAMMHARGTTAGPPYGWAASVLSPPSSSSDGSVPFVFGSAYDRLANPTYDFRYPYYNGFLGGGLQAPGCSAGSVGVMAGSYGNSIDGDRFADSQLPQWTGVLTVEELEAAYHMTAVHKKHDEIVQQLNASLVALHWLEAGHTSTDSDPEPEEIAAIYSRPEFLLFRQRYIDNMGPARNAEKVRRSMANMKIGTGAGQKSCGTKRQKINETAKKSREAKRQKSVENEICVMYLTKKVKEMKEIKRRLMREFQ